MKVQRKKMTATVPSMAMGDIAFLLLIFFVILARAQDDSHLKWEPAYTQEVESAGQTRFSIVIDVDNKTYLNGKEIGHNQIAARLKPELEVIPQGKRTVLLKVHKDATATYFEPVIEAISQAGGELLHVLEEERMR